MMQESGCECVCADRLLPSRPFSYGIMELIHILWQNICAGWYTLNCRHCLYLRSHELRCHISRLTGHVSHASFTEHSLTSILPIRIFTLSLNSLNASGVTTRTSMFTNAATDSSMFCAINQRCYTDSPSDSSTLLTVAYMTFSRSSIYSHVPDSTCCTF